MGKFKHQIKFKVKMPEDLVLPDMIVRCFKSEEKYIEHIKRDNQGAEILGCAVTRTDPEDDKFMELCFIAEHITYEILFHEISHAAQSYAKNFSPPDDIKNESWCDADEWYAIVIGSVGEAFMTEFNKHFKINF